jgi:hypothetical protein
MRNLDSLTIYRFRGLQDVELPSLGQVTVLTGISGIGKTSLLEAIATYCAPLDLVGWVGIAWQRELKTLREPFLDSLRWLFPQDNIAVRNNLAQGEILMAGTGLFGVRRLQATFQPFEGIWAAPPEDEQETVTDEELTLCERAANLVLEVDRITLTGQRESLVRMHELWEHRPLTARGEITDPSVAAMLINPYSFLAEPYPIHNLTEALTDFQEELIAILQSIDPDIKALEVLALRGCRLGLYVRHRKLGLVPLAIFGEHIRRLVHLGLTIYRMQGGIILLDEIEVTLPDLPTCLPWLTQLADTYDVQIIATTQQLSLEHIPDHVVVYQLQLRDTQILAERIELAVNVLPLEASAPSLSHSE